MDDWQQAGSAGGCVVGAHRHQDRPVSAWDLEEGFTQALERRSRRLLWDTCAQFERSSSCDLNPLVKGG